MTNPNATGDELDRWIGRTIDRRYDIIEILGEGGMGAVFIAEHRKLKKKVALKVVRDDFLGNAEVMARFAREAMAAARVDHPNVVGAIDYGNLPGGGAYMVMPLVQGRDLQTMLEEKSFLWSQACDVGAQVADASAAAHAAGIVHRDLKPENVLLETRGDGSQLVKILDFGVARVALDEDRAMADAAPGRALTHLGMVVGTPGYMAPEQATGDTVDHTADLYSLGVVLWEMISGQALFPDRELSQVINAQLTHEPPSLLQFDASVPPRLDALIRSLLARAPEDRPNSASEVRDVLRSFAYQQKADIEVGTAKTALAASSVEARDSRVATAPAMPAAKAPGSPLPWLAIALGAGVGLLIAIVGTTVGLLLLSSSNDPEPVAVPTGESPTVEPLLDQGPPEEVQQSIDEVLHSETRGERRTAARKLQAHTPEDEVPRSALAVATLELARNCQDKRAALLEIASLADPLALPAVERLDARPRRGCGLLRRSDCLACLREDLPSVLTALRVAGAD
ncbi:MAG: serine/threonine-protein kinase [Myxococcota bacterium]